MLEDTSETRIPLSFNPKNKEGYLTNNEDISLPVVPIT